MRERPSAEVNSVMSRSQPDWVFETEDSTFSLESGPGPEKRLAWRMKRRKMVSVTPAMGARTVAGRPSTGPIFISAGTGMEPVRSVGCSHSFFTVKPRPAMKYSDLTRQFWNFKYERLATGIRVPSGGYGLLDMGFDLLLVNRHAHGIGTGQAILILRRGQGIFQIKVAARRRLIPNMNRDRVPVIQPVRVLLAVQAPDQAEAIDLCLCSVLALGVRHSDFSVRLSNDSTLLGPRRGGGLFGTNPAVSVAYLAGSAFAYLRRKRSTRPAVSTRRCLPVKNGWQTEQIST